MLAWHVLSMRSNTESMASLEHKFVISRALALYWIYMTMTLGLMALGLGHINPIHHSCPWYNIYVHVSPTEAILQRHCQCDICYTYSGSWYIPLMFDTCPGLVISTLTPCIVATTNVATVFTISSLVFKHTCRVANILPIYYIWPSFQA